MTKTKKDVAYSFIIDEKTLKELNNENCPMSRVMILSRRNKQLADQLKSLRKAVGDMEKKMKLKHKELQAIEDKLYMYKRENAELKRDVGLIKRGRQEV